MRKPPVSKHLLVFTIISAMSLVRSQSTTGIPQTTAAATTTTSIPQTTAVATTITTTSIPQTTALPTTVFPQTTTTAQPWAAPAIFYPFGSMAGDTQISVNGASELFSIVVLSSPFLFFGRTYNQIYVNNNGLLTFNQEIPEADAYPFPTRGNGDLIAPLWTELDDYGLGVYSYNEYTNGSVLIQATQDINQYFPDLSFNATWVFVATWDFVQTWDSNTFNAHSGPAITFQAVLISDGEFSFILMNYGDCGVTYFQVEAGYCTINSTDYFVIPGSTDGNTIPNLKDSTNVNVPGRWAFRVDSVKRRLWTAPEIFYPFGSMAGDLEYFVFHDESSYLVGLSSPFKFFENTYYQLYVNNNGLLTFTQPIPEANPFRIPANSGHDFIAPLWTELDDYGIGLLSYQQYTSGSVLTRATQDINQYFPDLAFNATWVFVATWDFVQTWDVNTFRDHSVQAITVQGVLISDGEFSFILMNYGDCSTIGFPVEAGYDTARSTDYYVIPGSTDSNYIPNLKISTNINVPGRWAFKVDHEIPRSWTAPEIFYPFGSTAGDTTYVIAGDESYYFVGLSSPFMFFGSTYNQLYVNNNGLLTFTIPIPEADPFPFPAYSGLDLIAPLWTELDDYGIGMISYQEYTTGSVLTRASQDINQYFHGLSFTATWVFVATWDFVETWDVNTFRDHSVQAITVQAVLISNGDFSFILMNYGDCGVIYRPVEAGYDTPSSTDYYVIPGSTDSNYLPNLKNSTNINVPGRWAFCVSKDAVIGLQMRLTSFSDLTVNENVLIFLENLKQELSNRGVSSNIKLTARKVQKTKP